MSVATGRPAPTQNGRLRLDVQECNPTASNSAPVNTATIPEPRAEPSGRRRRTSVVLLVITLIVACLVVAGLLRGSGIANGPNGNTRGLFPTIAPDSLVTENATHLYKVFAGQPGTTSFTVDTRHLRGGETLFVICDHGSFTLNEISNRCVGHVDAVAHTAYDKKQSYTLHMNVDAPQAHTWGVAIYSSGP